ncbi:hypothetical protein QE443_003142 [Pantoea ananatis]|nr:hypothetical protein [Pantoea ananatis]MDQ1226981.1 hypothetical protein [Pantoea ananatis]
MTSNYCLSALPNIFFDDDNKNLNYQLIKEILQVDRSPSKKIKNLFKKLESDKPIKHEMFSLISQKMIKGNFRQAWYDLFEDNNHGGSIAPFNFLVANYIAGIDNSFDVDSKTFSHYFSQANFKKRKKYYPKPEFIGELVDNAIKNKDVGTLFLWVLIENIDYALSRGDTDERLIKFKENVFTHLKEKSDLKTINSLTPNTLHIIHLDKTAIKTQEQTTLIAAPILEEKSVEQKNPLETDFNNASRILQNSYSRIKGYVNNINTKNNAILTTISSEQNIEQISLQLINIKEELSSVNNTLENLHLKIKEFTNRNLTKIGYSFGVTIPTYTSVNTIPNLIKDLKSFELESIKSFLDLLKINSSAYIIEVEKKEAEKTLHSFKAIELVCEDIIEEIGYYEKGITALQKTKEIIEFESKDFTWNFFNDEKNYQFGFLNIFRYKSSKLEFDDLLYVSASKLGTEISEELCTLIERKLAILNKRNLFDIIKLINFLPLQTTDYLECKSYIIKPIICLAHINLALQPKISIENKHILINSKTVIEFKSGTNKVLSNFLNELTHLINKNTFKNGYSFLVRKINSASNNDRNAELEDKYVKDLKSILAFYNKGGGTTYSHIWSEAYKDTFSPLLKLVESRELTAFIDFFDMITSDFDLESKLISWKANIPEHLKKRSEYNKNIKNAVRSKFEEIQNYIEENNYFINDFKSDDLNIYIKQVLLDKNPESKFFQYWLNNIIDFEKSASNYAILKKMTYGPLDLSFDRIPSKFLRTSIKIIKGKEITNDDLLNDTLINYFQEVTSTDIAQKYLDNDVLEGYSKLINEIENDDINLDLERSIEKKIEDKIELYEDLIQKCRDEIYKIADSERDLFSSDLLYLSELLQQQQWHELDRRYNEFGLAIESYFKDEKEKTLKNNLITRINIIKGSKTTLSDYNMLIKEHEKLMQSMSSRIQHIKQLERLKNTEIYKLNLEKVINDAIEHFYNVIPYPLEQQSQMISFTWQQVLDPLILELFRFKTLLPSYSIKLLLLTETFIVNLISSDSLNEKSSFNDMILSMSETWSSLPSTGEVGIERINLSFIDNGYEIVFANKKNEDITNPTEHDRYRSDEIVLINDRNKLNELLLSTKKDVIEFIISNTTQDKDVTLLKESGLSNMFNEGNWKSIYNSKPEITLTEKKEISINNLYIINWCISAMLHKEVTFSIKQISFICHLINLERNFFDNIKGKTLALNLILYLLKRVCYHSDSPFTNDSKNLNQADLLSSLYNNINNLDKHENEVCLAFMNSSLAISFILKNLWDSFTGDTKQAESRAFLMYIFWHLQSSDLLSQCLTFSPVDLDSRKASALANISKRALVEKNNELLQPLYDLKNVLSSKPYSLLIDLIRKVAPVYTEEPASFEFIGPLEFIGKKNLKGRLRISPRKNDAPDSIIITLPPKGPIRFEEDKIKKEFLGPFLMDTIINIEMTILVADLEDFNIEIDIEAVSITGIKNKFSSKLNIKLTSEFNFSRISLDDIEDAFDNFPEQQMRGEDYVPRIEDEKKIEKSLVTSKSIRSIWITSPRRSGKTTMLYWILDAYSHKADRDIIVMYFTLDESFKNTIDFNKWLWRRLRTIQANKELRSSYKDFDEIGKSLDFEDDVGTFMSSLTDLLIKNSEKPASVSRIVFMFDEVDRFASMHFSSSEQKDTVNTILWQIRTMISNSRNIGVVFAGSTAAKEIFIKNPVSPFYNSIEHIDLTPFSCKNQESEYTSRRIVEPLKFRGKFQLSKQSLEHLLWVCAGIPYYMKLLSGATYSVIRQGKIIESDINDGLYALLNKNTGISKLDGMGAAAGTDDLRTTLTLENNQAGIIARAVLFTLAELYSPVSGHSVLRGKLTSNESKLSYEYKLSKKQINDGIDTCLRLGLIDAIYSENITKLYFSIPILGESIRFNSHKFWA